MSSPEPDLPDMPLLSSHLYRLAATSFVRLAVRRRLSRAALNALYLRLPTYRQRHLHHRYCSAFRNSLQKIEPGVWRVRFAGKEILAPLRREHAWLDWDQALSLTGHDVEVKAAYERMISGSARPDLFVDIGANYGTHSLLFLCHGIETLTFEPNPECHDYFRAACAANGVEGDLQPVALGDEDCLVKIRYPRRATWLGSIAGADDATPLDEGWTEAEVPQRKLDDCLERLRGRRTLIKIDAEGSEMAILRGGAAVLAERRPTVIFESLREAEERARIFAVFEAAGYEIENLPGAPLTLEVFQSLKVINFLARPR